MNQADAQPVLRCELCKKPFDRQSTLKRHGYYCRSRRVGQTNRVRSCACCSKSKVRCDGGRPACKRCTTKNTPCQYPSATSARDRNEEEAFNVEARNDGIIASESELICIDPSLLHTQEESLDIDFNTFWTDHSAQTEQTPSFLDLGVLPAVPSLTAVVPSLNVRSFFMKPSLKNGTQRRIASLILHNLRSYPQMIRQKTLPPFIHPQFASSGSGEAYMEPLANCISLMYMIGSGLTESRSLFWKNVELECNRIIAECVFLTRWQLLAAMQALSIYVFVRIDEGEKEYNNCDQILVSAVICVAQELRRSHMSKEETSLSAASPHALWKQWVYKESCRRLSVIYRVINILVSNFTPNTMCSLAPDLIIAPLPSRKQLWEAPDEISWIMEGGGPNGCQNIFALNSSGEIVRLMEGPRCGEDLLVFREAPDRAESGAWEEWCAGMDSFGGLVMLAASLVPLGI